VPESNSSTDRGYVVGRLGRPHGLDGYLGLYVDEPDVVHFRPGNTVTIEDRPYVVRAVRRADRGYQVQFKGVTHRDLAEELRGHEVRVEQRRQLEDDEYWPAQLAGLTVRDETGKELGVVRGWIPGSAQDRLVVEVEGVPYEVPFISEFVPEVDIAAGFVELRPIPGLIEPIA